MSDLDDKLRKLVEKRYLRNKSVSTEQFKAEIPAWVDDIKQVFKELGWSEDE